MSLKSMVKKIPGVMIARNLQLAFCAPYSVRRESRKKIKELKNKYEGKRCFIIGNGPSLTAEDLDKLRGEITFAANTIYAMFNRTEWRPTFYCVQDENVLSDIGEDNLLSIIEKPSYFFIRMHAYKILGRKFANLQKCIFVPIWNRERKEWGSLFTAEADRYIYDGSTVTFMSMQLAAYMGFQSIYLVGVDNSFPYRIERDGRIVENDANLKSHFFDGWECDFKNSSKLFKANYQEYCNNSYMEAEKYSRRTGSFRIYNATRGGKLEIFERVDLDEVLSHEP